MQIFDVDFFSQIALQANHSQRLRQHFNVHANYDEPCQKLFNAIQPGSYIRPHRHRLDPKNEMLVAIKGLMALIIFDDVGGVREKVFLGSEKHMDLKVNSVAVEITPDLWHTVLALEKDSVLLEIKLGPFNPLLPKELAPWAPAEGSVDTASYMDMLMSKLKL